MELVERGFQFLEQFHSKLIYKDHQHLYRKKNEKPSQWEEEDMEIYKITRILVFTQKCHNYQCYWHLQQEELFLQDMERSLGLKSQEDQMGLVKSFIFNLQNINSIQLLYVGMPRRWIKFVQNYKVLEYRLNLLWLILMKDIQLIFIVGYLDISILINNIDVNK